MDNLGKALYMATGVLLFIMAMTSSIILYNRIIDSANTSLAISDMGIRAESSLEYEEKYSTRDITHADVIASLMNINSLYVTEVKVLDNDNNLIHSYEPVNDEYLAEDGINKKISTLDFGIETRIPSGVYTYNYSNNVITYKKQG